MITADHAAQTGNPFFGVLAPGVTNPPCGPTPPPSRPASGPTATGTSARGHAPDEVYLDPSPAVAALAGQARPATSRSRTRTRQIAACLNDRSLAKKREAADAVLDMPGVVASFYINAAQNDYTRFGTNRMTGQEHKWFDDHADALVDTMANNTAPDVVGITGTDVTYGVMGDHGGSQELVQNIPMVFYGPGVSHEGLDASSSGTWTFCPRSSRRWAWTTTRATSTARR